MQSVIEWYTNGDICQEPQKIKATIRLAKVTDL